MSKDTRMKLADFAKVNGMGYSSVYRLWQQGHIEGVQLPTGTILVSGWKENKPVEGNRAIIYSRVPTIKQKALLDQQTASVAAYAERQGYTVIDIIEEIGLGFSDSREQFLEILRRADWDVLVVEDKEIAIKFGFEYLATALAASDRSIDFKTNLDISSENIMTALFTTVRHVIGPLIGIGSNKKKIDNAINRLAS